jgi:hypothetical protein
MKRLETIGMMFVICSLSAAPLWSQSESAPAQPSQPVPAVVGAEQNSAHNNAQNNAGDDGSSNNAPSDDRMLTPPPVSGENYPTALSGQERSNYLRGGVNFTSAYSDNAVGPVNGHPLSDISYSVAPLIALDETTPRTKLTLSYAPGFTFYQRISSRNEADQNANIDFSYRLSPHVTFTAHDGFQKSSNVFNQPDPASAAAVSGGAEGANFSILTPIADRLSNAGSAEMTYQFSRDGMIGVSGTFSNLHFPDQAQVPGLFDSSSQGGSAFYSHRLSKLHYIGATYQYQRLVSYLTGGVNETQTHAILFFYTLYVNSRLSLSFFGGPQHSDSVQPPLPPLNLQLPAAKAWTPAAGASLSWQGKLTSAALSYSHVISGGGGLSGAVHLDSGSASLRQQLTKTLSGSVAGGYAQNDIVGSLLPGTADGHSLSASALLQQQFGQHLSLQLGYTRLHQSYSDVAVISVTPDTNREFVSLSYQFSRPLGR